eukprot:TRINITY_DN1458_c0_g1_i8.p1 TRINITY_DN1458_c0_g1~~TRINITY_DN1458_c0_g1_i8.p1  ORF type:complete len:577 (-),score=173.58 TRINITY_DN1458_c0_g1_i8:1337-3067(-)
MMQLKEVALTSLALFLSLFFISALVATNWFSPDMTNDHSLSLPHRMNEKETRETHVILHQLEEQHKPQHKPQPQLQQPQPQLQPQPQPQPQPQLPISANPTNENKQETAIEHYERIKNFKDPEERRHAVKMAMKHAWDAYEKYAWGMDELEPLSKKGKDWLGMGLTIVDSLDTLYIMEMKEEFERAKNWVRTSMKFESMSAVSVFETVIRNVGGLLSAYDLSKDKLFLQKAEELGRILIHAYNQAMPHISIDLRTKHSFNPSWTSQNSILAEAGTIQLEFSYLSNLTGDPIFREKALAIFDNLESKHPADGLYPIYLNTQTGAFSGNHITLGAMGDSFYEYLIKFWIFMGGPGSIADKYKAMYDRAVDGISRKLIRTTQSGLTYIGEHHGGNGEPTNKMDELACFAGGMFALGSKAHANDYKYKGAVPLSKQLELGAAITHGCHEMWHQMTTGIAPEVALFTANGIKAGGARYYILRPETVESFFYLWRFTHEQKYRDWGWEAFLAIEKHCRNDGGGYSGIRDVTSAKPDKDNLQQSFFLAETLKYLYLLFSPDDVIPLDKYVFNTEAHPFSILGK